MRKTSKSSNKSNKRLNEAKKRRGSSLDTKSSATAARDEVSSPDNDPSWYALTPSLLRDAASIPFSNAVGLPFESGRTEGTIPGICGMPIRLVPGTSDFADSPINVAARNIYSWVRHANSGSRNYDSPNLMMYLMAMDNLYAIYSHCARMYGLIRIYAQKNRYYPRAFFDLIGWDYDDFVANQAQFRLWLNTFVERVGSMCVPANMTFMLRHMWMFQHVWLDGPTTKAQTYFFYPQEVFSYYYDKDSADYPIQLRAYDIARNPWVGQTGFTKLRVNNVCALIDNAVQSILSREDLAIMSGDILKAYGENGVWKLVPIHEDFVVLPTFSQEVMYQIHNSSCVDSFDKSLVSGVPVYIAEYADSVTNTTWLKTMVGRDVKTSGTGSSANIAEDFLFYMNHGIVRGNAGLYRSGSQLINFHHEEVTPEDIMVATRLKAAYDTIVVDPQAATKDLTITALAGSEVMLSRKVLKYEVINGQLSPIINTYGDAMLISMVRESTLTATTPVWYENMADLPGLFEFFPILTGLNPVTSQNTKTLPDILDEAIDKRMYGSLENYATVNQTILKNMHLAALMSEFYVPQMGAVGNHVAPQ